MLDFARGTNMRLTFDPLAADGPVWSPDGSRIAFSARDAGPGVTAFGLYSAPANGAGTPEMLFKSMERMSVDSWSSDGRLLIYTAKALNGQTRRWSLALQGNATPMRPMPAVKNNFNNWDGQILAGCAVDRVCFRGVATRRCVRAAVPRAGGRWQISASGGSRPVWRRDGKELFFVTPERVLMSVAIESGSAGFRADAPRPMFKLPGRGWYTASDDGRRFLLAAPVEREPAALNLALNWTEEAPAITRYD